MFPANFVELRYGDELGILNHTDGNGALHTALIRYHNAFGFFNDQFGKQARNFLAADNKALDRDIGIRCFEAIKIVKAVIITIPSHVLCCPSHDSHSS